MRIKEHEQKLLNILENKISDCKKCPLRYNYGSCTPYWTPISRYVIVGESPGKEEVDSGESFVGNAGKKLWEIMAEFNLRKEQFAIINTVQCRPVIPGKDVNDKPNTVEINRCSEWVRKFIKIIDPEKVLLLGNYAMGAFTGQYEGIMRKNGQRSLVDYGPDDQYIGYLSVHPSCCIYMGEKGKDLLRQGIKSFAKGWD